MKIEIKFRGLRLDNNEWVYGGIAFWGEKVFIVFKCYPTSNVEIIPETVGQFTGLLDKNDKEIYEGDIVCYSKSRDFAGHKGVIGFYEAGFRIFRKPTETFPFDMDIYTAVDRLRLEVIGNRFENPELLEK
jgi:uncharacterized phage protein (TIGR01671 family)